MQLIDRKFSIYFINLIYYFIFIFVLYLQFIWSVLKEKCSKNVENQVIYLCQ